MAKDEVSRLKAEVGSIDFFPVQDWIIIRPINSEAFKRGKLQRPGGANLTQNMFQLYKEMPMQGIVVASGPGWMMDSGILKPTGVNIGDHVCVDSNTMVSDFIFKGVLYYKVRAGSIIGQYPDYASARFDEYDLSFSNPDKR